MRDLLLGLSIGFAAGISPGPLLLLVVTATLMSGWRAGVLTAMSPLITDVIVVALILLVLGQVPSLLLDPAGRPRRVDFHQLAGARSCARPW
jgi:threonine/homoserine/homoserine lactone efflux protein